MKIGSEEFKGVLFQAPQTSPESRKRKKKSKADSRRPKSHRSGYNFFFSEQYARFKAEYTGQEKLLIKEIGNMWNNLSPSDRQVYQEKGAEDVERYKRELSQYQSVMNSSAASTANASQARL